MLHFEGISSREGCVEPCSSGFVDCCRTCYEGRISGFKSAIEFARLVILCTNAIYPVVLIRIAEVDFVGRDANYSACMRQCVIEFGVLAVSLPYLL
jgi:hypothetical protein